jgi:hypothetical protein
VEYTDNVTDLALLHNLGEKPSPLAFADRTCGSGRSSERKTHLRLSTTTPRAMCRAASSPLGVVIALGKQRRRFAPPTYGRSDVDLVCKFLVTSVPEWV